MRYILFLFLSGCSFHECSLNPGLNSLLANPAKKVTSVDVGEVVSDPLHNVSAVLKCPL